MKFSRTRGNIQIQPTIRRNQSSVPQEVHHRCYEFWGNHRPIRIIDLQPEYTHRVHAILADNSANDSRRNSKTRTCS